MTRMRVKSRLEHTIALLSDCGKNCTGAHNMSSPWTSTTSCNVQCPPTPHWMDRIDVAKINMSWNQTIHENVTAPNLFLQPCQLANNTGEVDGFSGRLQSRNHAPRVRARNKLLRWTSIFHCDGDVLQERQRQWRTEQRVLWNRNPLSTTHGKRVNCNSCLRERRDRTLSS